MPSSCQRVLARPSAEKPMQNKPQVDLMARELRENGFDHEQGARHDFAFVA